MLAQGQLTTTNSAIYTFSSTAKIKTILLFNAHTTNVVVDVYAVPNNAGSLGTPGADNQILKLTIASGDTFEFSPAYPVEYSATNDAIFAKADTGSVIAYYVMGVVG